MFSKEEIPFKISQDLAKELLFDCVTYPEHVHQYYKMVFLKNLYPHVFEQTEDELLQKILGKDHQGYG